MDGWRRGSQGVALAAAGLGLGLAGRELLQRLRRADLRGQVALVTGSSRGLGFLLAREFARQGCRVALCARDQAELDRAREELERRGAEVITLQCDIGDRQQVEVMVAEVTDRFSRIDILVNNAGIIQVGPIQNQTVEDFQQAMDIMFWGGLYATMAVLPQMLQRHSGRIVNITSIGAKLSMPHLLPYNAAKFAAMGLSEGLHAELAREGIQVTTIVPGLMRTGSHLQALFKGRQEREYSWFALGASLPLISMDAERAARQIVDATRRGETERILSLPANLASRFHGLFPGATANILDLVNRWILPKPAAGETAMAKGMEAHQRLGSPLLSFLTGWGLRAAQRFNQNPPESLVSGPRRQETNR